MTIRSAALLCNQCRLGGVRRIKPRSERWGGSPHYDRGMFEYHGWITVRESAAADDDEQPRLRQIADELRLRIALMDSPYEHVAEVAPGSYGLLHVRDDEDPGHENEVRVLRLVRGRITQHTETLLSPCIPTVEDPFTG
ncbi:Imm7 family immunity protein [Streptomyces microflavus]|uniref:Imm7 family immunity protein n=2 Tax=Streptomyces microflavus TaxID=1919 RepID=UPI0033D1EA9B